MCVVIYSIIAILQSYDALYKLRDGCSFWFHFLILIFFLNRHQDFVKNSHASMWYFLLFGLFPYILVLQYNELVPKNMHVTNFVITVKVQTLCMVGDKTVPKQFIWSEVSCFCQLVTRWCWCSGLSVHQHNFFI
jgi:hypothetical protein